MKTGLVSQVSRSLDRASAAARLFVLAGMMLALNGAQAAVDTSAYPYSMDITFSGYTGSTTLTNFPVLVVLTNGLSGFSYSQMESPDNAGDLRFTDEAGTAWLNYEIETWNTFSGSAISAPTELSGSALWLLRTDAGVPTNESGDVTNWVDQSGNGKDAFQEAPLRQPHQKYGLSLGGEPWKSCVWVQVPQLAASTKIVAYWGNLEATPPPGTLNGSTWDSSYVGVWHALGKTD